MDYFDAQKFNAEINMNSVDGLEPEMRALVYEYGLVIVASMINDGYEKADELRTILEARRDRLQEEYARGFDAPVDRRELHE